MNPGLEFDFVAQTTNLFFAHQYLPFIILSFIFSVLIFSFIFLFFYKQSFNQFFLSKALGLAGGQAQGVSDKLQLVFITRHIFNFFSKAWLFDVFVAKLARLSFFFSRMFIQRLIENGLFEYMLVLFPVRALNKVAYSLRIEGSMSGRLSIYFLNIVLGALGAVVFFIIIFFWVDIF